ncbi:MAG: FeoB-associated Cys-rich membrane protein [Lachnospiraceae bacterium]|nr:FeoB-associated Cys-rich membrane protein [Lachnospiraceae bacterium]
MDNIIIIAILVVVIGSAIAYIIKAKKSGVKCIGCPNGGNCAHKNDKSSSCNCGCNAEEKSECNCSSQNN